MGPLPAPHCPLTAIAIVVGDQSRGAVDISLDVLRVNANTCDVNSTTSLGGGGGATHGRESSAGSYERNGA